MTIYILTMPGLRASTNCPGSFLRSTVIKPVLAMPEFRDTNVRLLSDADPSVNDGIKFCHEHNVKGNSLLLAGKSYGAADITIEILKDTINSLERYDRIALFTVDLYGHRYRHRKNPYFNTVPLSGWVSCKFDSGFKATNVYHRNGGIEGASVYGATNVIVKDPGVNHMNIVEHETVKLEFETLLRWTIGKKP